MKNIVYKFTTIKTGVLVEKSWSPATEGVEDYYNREQENYAFSSYAEAADWLKGDQSVKTEAAPQDI
jgi:hypothetical protein